MPISTFDVSSIINIFSFLSSHKAVIESGQEV